MVETMIHFSVKSLLSWGNIPLNAFQIKLNILRIHKRLFAVSLVQRSIDASLSKKKTQKKEVPFFIKTKQQTNLYFHPSSNLTPCVHASIQSRYESIIQLLCDNNRAKLKGETRSVIGPWKARPSAVIGAQRLHTPNHKTLK